MAEDRGSWRDKVSGWARRAEEEARAFAERAEEARGRIAESPAVGRVAEGARSWSRRVAESVALAEARARLAGAPVWEETSRAAAWVRGTEAWRQLEQASLRARERARAAGERVNEARAELEALIEAVNEAQTDPSDRARVLRAAATAFERAAPQLDLLADAVAVGFVRELGAGMATVDGTEVLFVPADGPVRARVRVSRVVGRAARLEVGGHVGGYVAAFYGPRSQLVSPVARRGANLGLLIASLGFFRGTEGITGWMFELSAGAALGVPILSDLSAFELEEVVLAAYALDPAEAERFEAALAAAPDRPRRRHVTRLLARDPHAKPG